MGRDIEAVRAARRRWYAANKEHAKQKSIEGKKRQIARNAEYVNKIKEATCTDCGIQYPPYVMDFDHLGEEAKIDGIANMVHRPTSLEKIQLEIEKCELVCANCHRIRTHSRLQVTGVPEA